MKKIIGLIATALVALAPLAAKADVPLNWREHKAVMDIYRLDLAGTAPSLAQVRANNLKAGDMVLDTSVGYLYFLKDVDVPTFTLITTNGIQASALDRSIVTNVMTAGMVLPAVDAGAATNLNLGDASNDGNIAEGRMTNVLRNAAGLKVGAWDGGSVTNLNLGDASNDGNILSDRITNALNTAGLPLGALNGGSVTNLNLGDASNDGNILLARITNALNTAGIVLLWSGSTNSLNAAVQAATPVTNTYIKGDSSTGSVVIVDVGGFSIIKTW